MFYRTATVTQEQQTTESSRKLAELRQANNAIGFAFLAGVLPRG